MAIKFQYNKTSLQQLEKQLKVRVRTLPIIKNKESALRMEVKRCKADAAALDARLEKEIQAYEAMFALWNEFDASLIKVSDVHLGVKKIAGVRVPLLENVDFEIRPSPAPERGDPQPAAAGAGDRASEQIGRAHV